ncbi:MAG: type I methionyl aminopeptidase [bacterium]|jgi:methionyl aminopeptidase|nr:type I methionyl aminopeptidase [bacterium]
MIALKSRKEIDRIQESVDIVSDTLNKIIEIIEPGITTAELDRFAEKNIRGYGAKPVFKGYRGYPYATCISINEEVVHGFPSERQVKNGDLVSIDIGVKYQGFVGDSARTIPVGEISPEARLLLMRSYQALDAGCRAATIGHRIGDISHAVEHIANLYGYGVVRDFVGHGVGRELHEDPQIPNYGKPGKGPRLQEGMVLAIEPMLNLGTHEVEVLEDRWTVVTKDRSLSVHVENMVAVLPEGPRVLTHANGVILPGADENPL